MTIGSFTNTFFDSIRNDVNTSVDENDKVIVDIKSELENAKNHLTEMIASGLGGYVVKTRDELLIMDTDNIDTAVKVWRWNKNGLAYSSTGYYGQYEIGITADGQIVGDRIVAGSIKAESIEVNLRQKIISSQNEEEVKALIKADLNGFKSEISKTFVTVGKMFKFKFKKLHRKPSKVQQRELSIMLLIKRWSLLIVNLLINLKSIRIAL